MADARAAAGHRSAHEMERLDPFEHGAESMQALAAFGSFPRASKLEADIIPLAKARTLQLTGGRYGESECKRMGEGNPALAAKIARLADWYTSRAFSERERAALLWTEDVVYATHRGVPDMSYAEAARVFPPDELWAITVTVASECTRAQIAQTFRIAETIG
jgi:alkylhydroperoxidase family enzyme